MSGFLTAVGGIGVIGIIGIASMLVAGEPVESPFVVVTAIGLIAGFVGLYMERVEEENLELRYQNEVLNEVLKRQGGDERYPRDQES